MAISSLLADFDGLIDIVVEQIVREIQDKEDAQIKTPARWQTLAGDTITTGSPTTTQDHRCRKHYYPKPHL
jgi:hypothetical protein